jgi:hypothetical protein
MPEKVTVHVHLFAFCLRFSIQLACDAQIPSCLNGPEGKVVYIDTEGSFMASRAAQIAHALVQVVNPQIQRQAEVFLSLFQLVVHCVLSPHPPLTTIPCCAASL